MPKPIMTLQEKMDKALSGKLTDREIEWLKKLFEVDFPGKDILVEQASQAIVSREVDEWHYNLMFDYEDYSGPKFLLKAGSPVDMQFLRKSRSPIMFDLLVWDWKIDQLLIQSADPSDKMQLDDLVLKDPIYHIDSDLESNLNGSSSICEQERER